MSILNAELMNDSVTRKDSHLSTSTGESLESINTDRKSSGAVEIISAL